MQHCEFRFPSSLLSELTNTEISGRLVLLQKWIKRFFERKSSFFSALKNRDKNYSLLTLAKGITWPFTQDCGKIEENYSLEVV